MDRHHDNCRSADVTILGGFPEFEREFIKASAFALAGAVLTYFGFMHGAAVGVGHGLGVSPAVALAYAIVAAMLFGLARSAAAVAMGPPS